MSERILDQFEGFDEPPPIEREYVPDARLMRKGKLHTAESLQRGQQRAHSIGALQRQSYTQRKVKPKITLATKA